jgi:hypothetical protein
VGLGRAASRRGTDVASRSFSEVVLADGGFRFTPQSGHPARTVACLKSAKEATSDSITAATYFSWIWAKYSTISRIRVWITSSGSQGISSKVSINLGLCAFRCDPGGGP